MTGLHPPLSLGVSPSDYEILKGVNSVTAHLDRDLTYTSSIQECRDAQENTLKTKWTGSDESQSWGKKWARLATGTEDILGTVLRV